MNDTAITGGCLCGEVRYECTSLPNPGLYCHCRNCQKAHAAPYAALTIVPPSNITITKGEVAHYERTSESENMTYREFCPNCGTQLFSGSLVHSQVKSIKIATLDNPNLVKPDKHVWLESSVDWVCLNDGLPQFDKQPSSTEQFSEELYGRE